MARKGMTLEEIHAARDRALEIRAILETWPDEIIGRSELKDLAGMLAFVNYVFFAVTGWLGFLWLAPIVNGDDRPAWLMWLILGPIVGLTFGGVGGWMIWMVAANPLGTFVYKRQGKKRFTVWWRRLVGEDDPEF